MHFNTLDDNLNQLTEHTEIAETEKSPTFASTLWVGSNGLCANLQSVNLWWRVLDFDDRVNWFWAASSPANGPQKKKSFTYRIDNKKRAESISLPANKDISRLFFEYFMVIVHLKATTYWKKKFSLTSLGFFSSSVTPPQNRKNIVKFHLILPLRSKKK